MEPPWPSPTLIWPNCQAAPACVGGPSSTLKTAIIAVTGSDSSHTGRQVFCLTTVPYSSGMS